MEISRAFKIVSFCISDFEGPSFLRTCPGFFSFATRLKIRSRSSLVTLNLHLHLLLASLPSLENNSLDDEAKRVLTEAAKTRGVALEM